MCEGSGADLSDVVGQSLQSGQDLLAPGLHQCYSTLVRTAHRTCREIRSSLSTSANITSATH